MSNSFNYNYTNTETTDNTNEFNYKTWVNGSGIREIDSVEQRPTIPECTGIFYVTKDNDTTYWYNPTKKLWRTIGSGGSGGSANWGEIGGDINTQLDLINKIDKKENLVYHQNEEPSAAVAGDLWVTDDSSSAITSILVSKNNGKTYTSVVDDDGTARINLTETFNQTNEPASAVEGDVWVTTEEQGS